MTDLELHWLAGLLEGEGCFYVYRRGGQISRSIILVMTDRDIVAKAALLIGGRLTGPKKLSGTQKVPTWETSVSRKADVIPLLTALYPLMGERRQAKIKELINA